MNSCFKKFVDFKGIMTDELDRIVASKKVHLFNSIKITQKNVIFSFHQIIGILGQFSVLL